MTRTALTCILDLKEALNLDIINPCKVIMANMYDGEILKIPEDRLSLYDQTKDLMIRNFLGNDWNGKRILDLGCGPGVLSLWLADCGADVTGIERNERIYRTAMMNTAGRVKLLNMDLFKLDDLGRFDLVLAKDIIEHIEDEDGFAALVKRFVEPSSGRLFVSTHNILSLQYLLAGSFTFATKGKRYLGMDDEHVRMYSPASVSRFMKKADMKPESWLGCYHLPYRLLGGKWKKRMDVSWLHSIETAHGTKKPFCYLGWSISALASRTGV